MSLPSWKPYVGITITLTDNLAHNLYALLKAVDASCPATGRELQIQYDQGSDGGDILIGDALVKVSPQRCSYRLKQLDAKPYRAIWNEVPLQDIYILYTTGSTGIVNVEVAF